MNNNKSPLIHLYPDEFEIYLLYKTKYWQGIPILPDLDLDIVKKTIRKDKDNNSNVNSDVLIF